METITDLAWLLRQLRRRDARQRGDSALTYRELASKTGWSRAVIGAYFSGKILPPTDRLDVLIRLLGATPAEQGAIATLRDQVEENRRNRTAGSQDRDVNSRLFDVPGLVATPPQRIRDSLKPFAARRFTTLANLPAFHSAVPAAPHRLISHALSAAEARDLLVHRLGPRQALCEPHAVDEIIALCAGVPLALNIVAGHAAAETGCSLNRLAGELRDTRG